MRRHDGAQVLGAHDPRARERSAAEQQAEPLRHVADRRVDPAGGTIGVRPRELGGVGRERGHLAVDQLVRSGGIGGRLEGLLARRARPHAERPEQSRVETVRPGLPAGRPREIRSHQEEIVHVGELAPEARDGLDQLDLRDDVVGRVAEDGHAVASIRRHPAVLGHEVGYLELARHPGVVHLEARQMVDHPVGPGELPVVDLHRNQRRRECLRRRADLEEGVGIDGVGAAHALHAEALRVDDLIVLHDGNGETRDVPLLLRGLGVRFELGEYLVLRSWRLGAARRDRPRGDDDPRRHRRCASPSTASCVQALTVTRRNVAGMDVVPGVGLWFWLSKSVTSSFCRSAARPSFSAASNAFMVGP